MKKFKVKLDEYSDKEHSDKVDEILEMLDEKIQSIVDHKPFDNQTALISKLEKQNLTLMDFDFSEIENRRHNKKIMAGIFELFKNNSKNGFAKNPREKFLEKSYYNKILPEDKEFKFLTAFSFHR